MYDLIGDIHGHAEELEQMLLKLGYTKNSGIYQHPNRQVIFLGDFIDRGPQIKEVLELVRPMVEKGFAKSVMGNHELNALAFHTADPHKQGEFLRPHSDKNIHQHSETLRQVDEKTLRSHLQWFRTLPLFLDLGDLRVVHACWDKAEMQKTTGQVDDQFLASACKQDGELFDAVETVLKGKEAELPEGNQFKDKDGHPRRKTRLRWYQDPSGHTYGSYALATHPIDCDILLSEEVVNAASPYETSEPPVFIGHYWLSGKKPELLADNVACLDWSVARGGFLCAYRWDGEQKLSTDKFVVVS